MVRFPSLRERQDLLIERAREAIVHEFDRVLRNSELSIQLRPKVEPKSALQEAAERERGACADLLDELGHPELATKLRQREVPYLRNPHIQYDKNWCPWRGSVRDFVTDVVGTDMTVEDRAELAQLLAERDA